MQDGVVQKAQCVLSIDLSKSSWILACERQTFLLATSPSGEERGETSAVRRLVGFLKT